eukprot:TRINITY_DN1755_c0_g1_i1.p1 TRINITY_DN1755_c0_g1~~TRINITY_DN1755_c0_g1_i1.p1  ORF type:complete len:505 (+),score=104.69 TRINITY_DN1755_c0_g1_i1:219-1517(+)
MGKFFVEIIEKGYSLGARPLLIDVIPILVEPVIVPTTHNTQPGQSLPEFQARPYSEPVPTFTSTDTTHKSTTSIRKKLVNPSISVPLTIEGVKPEELSVVVCDPNSNECLSEIVISDGSVLLNVQTECDGTHTAILYANGSVIAELSLEYQKSEVIPEKLAENSENNLQVGKLTELPLSIEGVDPQSLFVTVWYVQAQSEKLIDSALVIDQHGILLNFIPEYPGLYQAHLWVGGETVAKISIEIAGEKLNIVWECSRLSPASMPLEIQGAEPEQLEVVLKNSIGNIIPSVISKKGGDIYLDFVPVRKGIHLVQIYYEGNKIGEMAIRVNQNLQFMEQQEKVKRGGSNLWEFYFGVDAPNLGKKNVLPLNFGGNFVVYITDPNNVKEKCFLLLGDEQYILFEPTVPGKYLFEIFDATTNNLVHKLPPMVVPKS